MRALSVLWLGLGAFHLFTQTSLAGYSEAEARGSQKFQFQVPDSSYVEECIIPQPFPELKYKDSDHEKELELCSYDFYGTQPGETTVGVCPKVVSTNPGLELHKIPTGATKESFEASECKKANDRAGKKLAKFKQSLTCSYTPSLLGYYHVSRILEGGRVPPSVIRTMDKAKHKAQVDVGISVVRSLYKSGTQVRTAWEKTWTEAHAAPAKQPRLFNDALTAIYGALSINPREEEKYREVSGAYKYETRYDTFKQQPPYKNLLVSEPVDITLKGKTSTEAFQRLVQMKDVSDMIIMDYMLNQQDRVGNIHFKWVWYWVENGKVMQENVDFKKNGVDPVQAEQMAARNAVQIKEMLMKDNDCGVTKSNMAKKSGLLNGIAHVSPRTYRRLLWLNQQLANEETKAYFQRELLFTADDYAGKSSGLVKNTQEVVAALQERCKSGKLHLDLSVQAYVDGTLPSDSKDNCELPAGYSPASD